MTSIAESPSCPRCGELMVLKTAARGSYAGQQFWACPRFPQCWGKRFIQPEVPAVEPPAAVASVAGGSAQAEFERRSLMQRERMRRLWPLLVGVTLVFMLGSYLVAQAYVAPAWAGLIAMVLGGGFILGVLQLPQTTTAWRRGAEGERRTAKHLDGLAEAGFVVLHDRRVSGYGGNLDHLAVGPSGVWAIETKRLGGKVVIDGDQLRVGGRRQDRIIDQVFRQAAAIQIALRDQLDPLGLTVTPIVCLHDGELPWFNRTVRGVKLASGRGLVRTMRDGPERLSAEQVQALARVVASRIKSAVRD